MIVAVVTDVHGNRPAFEAVVADSRTAGVDEIWCVSVNDAHVMGAWAREQNTGGKVRMLGDGSAELQETMPPSTSQAAGMRSRDQVLLIAGEVPVVTTPIR